MLWSIHRIVFSYFHFLNSVSARPSASSRLLRSIWPRTLFASPVIAHMLICIWLFLPDFCSQFARKSSSWVKVIFDLLSLPVPEWMCRSKRRHLSVILSMFWNSWGRLWLLKVCFVRLCLVCHLVRCQVPWSVRGFLPRWKRFASWCCPETYWDCFSGWQRVITFLDLLWYNKCCWCPVASLLR